MIQNRKAFIPGTLNKIYHNKSFEDISDLFLYACSHGDYIFVERLLNDGEVKTADISNKMGKSALQLAIENEHFEVVKVLLDKIPYEQFRDALLLAIYLGHINIAEFIMKHPTYRCFNGSFLDPTHPQAYDDSQFSSDISPLILASQYNRLPIVHELLSNGERIKKPHKSHCDCVDCAESTASDSLRQAQVRLSAYKGLSSEVYIALTYPDPILQAFELGHELRTLATVEHYFREEYIKLADQLSAFAAKLLDYVRGHDELEIILNKTGKATEEKYVNLARFDLAIQYHEKPFVSHSNCQQKLMEKWYEDIDYIKNAHLFKRIGFYLMYVLCLPFLSILYYFFPKSKFGALLNQPNLKLKAYIVSYTVFIVLIMLSSFLSTVYLGQTTPLSVYDENLYTKYIEKIFLNDKLRNDLTDTSSRIPVNCDLVLRPTEPNAYQIAIFIWILGFIWHEMKQIQDGGLRGYLTSYSNYIDCLMNTLYLLHFFLLFLTMLLTRLALNDFHSETYWSKVELYNMPLNRIEKFRLVEQTRYILYWLNNDRYYWNSSDLYNIAEGLFAMGNIVSICRICFLLPLLRLVGPLQVMLERMMADISKFIIIFAVFFIAFSFSLYLLFSYFYVTQQQQQNILNNINNSEVGQVLENNSTAQCPTLFFTISNETLMNSNTDTDTEDVNIDNSTCSQDENWDILEQVGPYPALYYFGKSIDASLLTTFFTLFGVIGENNVPDRGYELITRSCNTPDPSTYRVGFDGFSSNLGFILYGLFAFICVTVLINTLIAMMYESFDTIDERADIEWKFSRSKLYMEYLKHGNTIPIPLNIIPSPKSFIYLFLKFKKINWKAISQNIIKKNNQPKNVKNPIDLNEIIQPLNLQIRNRQIVGANSGPINTNHIVIGFGNDNSKNIKRKQSYLSNEKLTYKIVIERIVKRFLLHYKNNSEDDKQDNDFRDFKNDISSLRFELLNQIDYLDNARLTINKTIQKLNSELKHRLSNVFSNDTLKKTT